MIDTGAAVSLVRRDVWMQIVKGDCTLDLEQWAGRRLVGVNGAVSGCKNVLTKCSRLRLPYTMSRKISSNQSRKNVFS